MKESRKRDKERKIQRKGTKFWMKGGNFWKSCRWLKKGHQKFLRIEGFFQNLFENVVWKYIFPKFLPPPIFCDPNFCPPNIYDKSTPQQLSTSSFRIREIFYDVSWLSLVFSCFVWIFYCSIMQHFTIIIISNYWKS